MATLDHLIQEILSTPGTSPVAEPARAPLWSQGSAEDAEWGWLDSSHGLLQGLEVTEHQVSSALCKAVFPNPGRHRSTPR